VFLNGGVVVIIETRKQIEEGVLYSWGREALMAVYCDGTQQRGEGEGGVHVAGWIRGWWYRWHSEMTL